jgi:predicted esterase
MATPLSRRSVLAAGAGAAAGLVLPGAAAHAAAHAGGHSSGHSTGSVEFTLDAETLDGGEQVIALTLATSRLGRVDPDGLTTGTFSVHAKAASPIPIAPGDQIFTEYDLDRAVTAVRVDRHGDIVLELSYAEGQLGGGTLGYIASAGRNVRFDLTYTITQNAPIRVRGRGPVVITDFVQGALVNPEVDAFGYRESRSGVKYRLFEPAARGNRPLVVWLHGGGEGGLLSAGYYDNETTLRANRGALGFATDQAQRIFAGAYVVAPQCTSYWLEDGDRFAPQISEIVADLARRYPIDRDRILVAGCSNGGYMSLKMTTVYPRTFAASVPICGVVAPTEPDGPPMITDDQLRHIPTPTWLVASLDDDTVNPQANTIHAHDLIPGSIASLYDHVIRDGYQFPGHWSWIYVARNDPSEHGTHIWQWMAQQRR